MPEVNAYLVPFSHADLFWLGAREECLSRGNRVLSEALDMVEKHPEFRFLMEDLVFVDHWLRCHPERKEPLRAALARGQIEVGPKWAGIDQTPQIGEDLVRNSLYALDYLERELGYAPRTVHLGDLPGWTPQYPQIMARLGIPYAVFTRLGPRNLSLFYWVGLDGSRALVWYALHFYTWAWDHGGIEVSVEKAKENGLETTMREILDQASTPIFVHWGVDLILPGRELPRNLRQWNEQSPIQMAFATPTEFFDAVPKEGLPALRGEVPSSRWVYADAEWPQYMGLAAPAVSSLVTAERFSSIAWMRDWMSAVPAERIRETWLQVLEVMDHNNNGQGTALTTERKRADLETALRVSGRIREDALRRVAEKVRSPFGPECYPIVVFNSTSWGRTDIVRFHATFHGDLSAFDIARYREVSLVDEAGNPVTFQSSDIREGVAREQTTEFVAQDVPPGGYRTYYLRPGAAAVEALPWEWDGRTLRTPFYAAAVDAVTGDLSVRDASTGRLVLSKACVVAIEEKLGNTSWTNDPTGRRLESLLEDVSLVDAGPVSATLLVRASVAGSRLAQRITFFASIPKIELVNDIDFREWRPMRLCQLFDPGIPSAHATYGVPYGVSSTADAMPESVPYRDDQMPPAEWRKQRNCILWVDRSGQGSGLTIGSPHRCFTFDDGAVLGVMIRAMESPACVHIRDGARVPHRRPSAGQYRFFYDLLPHIGGWMESKAYRLGWDRSYPLLPVVVGDSYTPKSLPPTGQLVDVRGSTDSLVLDVVKKAERSDEMVLRFHETEGLPGTARIGLPGRKIVGIRLADLRERSVRELESAQDVPYAPFEIVTVSVQWGQAD